MKFPIINLKGRLRRLCPALLAGLALTLPLQAQDLQLRASIDHNPVAVNEAFVYKLEISGTSSNLPDVELPDLSNFTVLSGPSQSSSFNMVNGAVSTSRAYSLQLLPKDTGRFTIPAVSVTHKGNTFQSNAITLTVTAQRSETSGGNAGRSPDEPYMVAVPSKRSVYVNEPLDLSFKVYFRQPIRNLNYLKQPETVGFWVEEYEIPSNIPVSKAVVNGVEYNVAEVKKVALFPTKSGQLTITPMQLSVNVQQSRRRRDPFGSVFDNFFDDPLGRTVRKVLSTSPLTFTVKPLPTEGRPANFSGLVGNFRMSASIDKTTAEANEALSLKIRLSGNGNLKSLGNIGLEFPNSFEVYDPKIRDNTDLSNNSRFSAVRELEYVVIPRTPGEYRIKPLEVSYFDPQVPGYKTLRSPEYTIVVGEGKGVPGNLNSPYLSKSEVKLLGKDINFIKEENLSLVPVGYQPYKTTWFWLTLVLPVVMLSLAYGYRNHLEKMSTNVEYARRRQAQKMASKRLKGAEHYLNQGKFAEFYGEVSKGLIGFVADKTNQAAAGLLREDVERILINHKVEAPLIHEYLKYLDEADFRRFAPGEMTVEAAGEFYHQALEMLSKLGKYL